MSTIQHSGFEIRNYPEKKVVVILVKDVGMIMVDCSMSNLPDIGVVGYDSVCSKISLGVESIETITASGAGEGIKYILAELEKS